MTKKLYDIDSHLKEFKSRVTECYETPKGFATVLEATAFFPEAGGQASDKGFIDGVEVFDVQIDNEKIMHYTEKTFEVGKEVECRLDWERRFDFMQQHSAEHIVSGVAHRLYGCENVGFHLSTDIVTLDFDKPLSDEQILKIEKEANEAVFNNVAFRTYYPDKETLDTLNYRSKKELEGDIRIVEIENTDICACCAPHVNTGAEIGIIKLLGTEKIRGGIRIELKAGRRAIADYNCKFDNVRKISAKLCVKQNETAEAVDRVLEQISGLKGEISFLKKSLIDEKIKGFDSVDTVTAHFEENLDMKELQHYADALFKSKGGIRAVFSPAADGYSFAICGEEASLKTFFEDFKSRFNVKGGGRGTMVQGTVFENQEEIEKYFNVKESSKH